MSVYTGFGTNYIANSSLWSADQGYFNKIGLNLIRIRPTNITYPWSLNTPAPYNYDYMRNMAINFQGAGFYTIFGPAVLNGWVFAGGSLTSTTWPQYHDAVVAEATYCQSQGIQFSEFAIGNELGNFIDGTTVHFSTLYGYIQQLFLDVAAVYSGKLTYALAGGEYPSWESSGIGNFSTISYHPYGVINTSAQTVSFNTNNINAIPALQSAFGTKIYISEFGLDSSGPNTLLLQQPAYASYMSTLWNNYIKNSGSTKNIIFGWRSMAGGDLSNQFAMLFNNGTVSSMNGAWYTFFSSNPTEYSTGQRADVTRSSVNRTSVPNRTSYPTRPLFQ